VLVAVGFSNHFSFSQLHKQLLNVAIILFIPYYSTILFCATIQNYISMLIIIVM